MKHLKAIWQLWGRHFKLLLQETGITMIIWLLFFSLGAGWVMVRHSITVTALSSHDTTLVFIIVSSTALCIGMAKMAAETIFDNDEEPEQEKQA